MSSNIDLKVNGRIFPNWIMKNFYKYKLPKIMRKDGEDPCDEKLKKELTLYQRFVSQYLSFKSPFRSLLIYHGVGSGKTVSAINIYAALFNYSPKWNVFLIIPASLRDDPWMKDLKDWLGEKDFESKMKNITFVHYDSPFADKDFLEKVKKKDASKDTIYIFDEVHKFIVNVYNNISSQKGKRAQNIYDYIKQEKKENDRTRIILLSATPAVNNPYEFALIYNLLRANTFSNSEAIFNQRYISSSNYKSINENTKNMFMRRILGLTSYYIGATPDKFASKTVHYKNILMSSYQQRVYDHFEEIEDEKEKKRLQMSRGKIGDNDMSTYSSYTRQACNFVWPDIDSDVYGEGRPRPGKFRIKVEDEVTVNEGRDEEKLSKIIKKKENTDYLNAINKYKSVLIKYFSNLNEKDIKKGHTLKNDINNFLKKYNASYNKFWDSSEKKSSLLESMNTCGPKMVYIIFNILKSSGPTLVYSNYVDMEGLAVFKIYLRFFSFIEFDKDNQINLKTKENDLKSKTYKYDFKRYMEFHGKIDRETRTKNKELFNTSVNKFGKVMKIILISPAGAEGLNLRNVRQVHIMEPFWNEVKIEQVIGRAIRICSHKDLPQDKRRVDVFRYKCVRKNGKETADQKLEDISRKKNNLLLSFVEAVKESAIDCELFRNHNMLGSAYRCFQFNQQSLFENPIGPAYKQNQIYDNKINNGLGSNDSKNVKIKVRKITAIEENEKESKEYWVDDETNIVYDFELDYPVGKLKLDEVKTPIKKNKNTYIITDIINVPSFEIFE